jgi:anti-sigma factor RsiW
MNHIAFERQLSPYVDNELSESEAKVVREHVEGCANCQRQVQIMHSIRKSIREAATVALPESFVYSVQRAVRREEQEYVTWLGPERFARNIVVALCIIVFVLVAIGNYLTPQPLITTETYINGEPSDSAAHAVIGTQKELSKEDVMFAALTK